MGATVHHLATSTLAIRRPEQEEHVTASLDRKPGTSREGSRPSAPPTRASGIYPTTRVAGVRPDLGELLDAARHVGDETLAAAVTFATSSFTARTAVSTPAGLSIVPEATVLPWLARVTETQVVPVPAAHARHLRVSAILAVPMSTPVLEAGVLGIPDRPGSAGRVRRLEALATDFALAVECADRDSQLEMIALADELDVDWA